MESKESTQGAPAPRVLLAGYGRLGHLRFRLFSETRALSCAAIVDPALGRKPERNSRGQLVPSFDKIADVPRESYDAVWVSVPTSQHPKVIEQALAAGVKKIYCEKMIAFNEAEVRRCYDMCEAAGAELFCGWMRRFDTQWVRLRDELRGLTRSDEIVALKFVSKDWPKVDIAFLKTLGSIFEDLMCHDFSLVGFYLGDGNLPLKVEAGGEDTTGAGIWDKGWCKLHYAHGKPAVRIEAERFGDECYQNVARVVLRSGRVITAGEDRLAMSFGDRYDDAFGAEVVWFSSLLRGENPERRNSRQTCLSVARLVNAAEISAKLSCPILVSTLAPAPKL